MPTTIITAIANAISSVFGWMTGRGAVNNAPDIEAGKEAQQEANEQDQVNNDIANKNNNAIENDIAE